MKFLLPLALLAASPVLGQEWQKVAGTSALYAERGWVLVGSSSTFTDVNNSLFIVTFWRETATSGKYIRCKDATLERETITLCEAPVRK